MMMMMAHDDHNIVEHIIVDNVDLWNAVVVRMNYDLYRWVRLLLFFR